MAIIAQATELIKAAERQIDYSREYGPIMYLLVISIVIMCSGWVIRFFKIELPERNARIESQKIHDACLISSRECHVKLIAVLTALAGDISGIREVLNFVGTERLREALAAAQAALDDSAAKWSGPRKIKAPHDE